MKKLIINLKLVLIFSAILTVFALIPLDLFGQTNSEGESKTVTVTQTEIDNAARAFDELALTDRLIESKEREIELLRERVRLEQEKSQLALEIADARLREAGALREANTALRDSIAAKNTNIANLEKEVEILKKKKPSLFRRILAVAAGIGIGIILK